MLTGIRDRIGRVDPRIVDSIAAVVVIVAIELTVWLSSGITASDRIVTSVAAILFAAPIAFRRVRPAAALVFSAAVVTVSMPFGGQLLSNDNAYVIPLAVLAYSVGAGLDTRPAVRALIGALALLWIWALLPGPDGAGSGLGGTLFAMFYVTILLGPLWLVGRFVRRHSGATTAFRDLAVRVVAEQDARDAAAIAQERARIGGELQDIIAHSVSAMVIQAGSARLMLGSDPDRARGAILNVEETGRQALSDLRRLLGMLRKDDDPRALSPQPGLGQLPVLIETVKRGGLVCERSTEGDPIHLTPGTDLVAYRVVETALRAAADQHGGHGVVTIRYQPRDLELEIAGDRTIPDLRQTFAPLAQRVALYHGELETQLTTTGFTVHARLPLETAVSA